jgi:chemosensory pili system protein ChpA (sensor histidine kinase/response regulator)
VDRLDSGELAVYLAGEPVTHSYGDHAYPVHNIGVLFGSEPAPLEETEDLRPPVLLFRSAETTVALQIDAILDKEEIIIKPVPPQLNAVPGISGATVLGDGRVVIVLDPASLARNIETLTGAATFVPRVRAKERERLQALVVDDSITMRKITTRLLERHDVQVRSAKDGVEAVAELEAHPPSFIILDIEMPRMDGFELLAHIRNQPHLTNIPVIMVTSRSGDKHRHRATRLGVDDYLIKPYQDDELLDAVRHVLETHGMELTA